MEQTNQARVQVNEGKDLEEQNWWGGGLDRDPGGSCSI